MTIVIIADAAQWNALEISSTGIIWVTPLEHFSFTAYPHADAFVFLTADGRYELSETTKPIFINEVIFTLKELNAGANVLRINGWNSFLQRPLWEVAGAIDNNGIAILEKLNKKFIPVKDEPGLVAATIIAMIINEAYFAWGDAISSKADIDTAMKLGTNYPYGPFEWAEKIGIKNIFTLLQKLSVTDKRYLPAATLTAAAAQHLS
jgi:3-hydroxybutyryl-CoA dehydrogenase